jgi:hypothetical protein
MHRTQREREKRLEVVPLLAALLSVPLPEGRYPPLLLTPQQQRQQTLNALVAFEATRRGDMLAEAYRLQGELLLR